ncbi:MAG TPA: hypothetical protein VGC24_01605, partial [Burkholderiaceae bacterium]
LAKGSSSRLPRCTVMAASGGRYQQVVSTKIFSSGLLGIILIYAEQDLRLEPSVGLVEVCLAPAVASL